MKTYWDTSALLAVIIAEPTALAAFNDNTHNRVTRTHSLSETFGQLTGGRMVLRMTPQDAAAALRALARKIEFLELDAKDVLEALSETRKHGVMGRMVHDYLHVYAAERAKAGRIFTFNVSDFEYLTDLPVTPPQ